MKSFFTYFFVFFTAFAAAQGTNSHLRILNIADPLENTINLRFQDLERLSKINCAIYATDQNTGAIKGVGIAININQINSIYLDLSHKNQESLLLLVIAHEMGHIFQYQTKPDLNIGALNDELKKVYEAQADLLALRFVMAYYSEFVEREIDDDFSKNISVNASLQTVQKEAQVIQEALELFYKLGERAYGINDHPTKLQRLNAVTAGIMMGYLDVMNFYINKYKDLSDAEKNKMEYYKLFAVFNVFPKLLDMDSGDKGLFNWSLHYAKLLTNYSRLASSDIVVVDRSVHSNQLVYPEYFNFSYSLKNIGDQPIKATIEFRVDSLDANPEKIKLESAKFLRRTIDPGSTEVFTDTLFYSLPQGAFKRTDLKFGAFDPRAKYTFEYVDSLSNIDPNQTSNEDILRLDKSSATSILNYFEYLRKNFVAGQYKNIIDAPGTLVNHSTDPYYTFPCIILADSISTARLNIKVNKSKADELSLPILDAHDYNQALSTYNTLKKLFYTHYQLDYNISESTDGDVTTLYCKSKVDNSSIWVSLDANNKTNDPNLVGINHVRIYMFNK